MLDLYGPFPIHAFNRTMVGLKYTKLIKLEGRISTFNRTMVGLKLTKVPYIHAFQSAL